MADSNSLILLPARQTARAPQHTKPTPSTKFSKTFKDDLFAQKLEKARTKTAHPVKKIIADVPTKPSVKEPAVKTASAKPVKTDAAQPPQAKPVNVKPTAELPKLEKDDGSKATEDKLEKPTDTHALPAVQEPSQPVLKKPGKSAKTEAAKPAADANPVHAATAAVAAVVTPISDNKDSSDGAGAEADAESNDPLTAAATAEFGTGKIATAVDGQHASASATAVEEADAAAESSNAGDGAETESVADPLAELASPADAAGKTAAHSQASPADSSSTLAGLSLNSASSTSANPAGKAPAAAVTPQARFAEQNHAGIISSIAGQLLPKGGTMQIRLDPPELGALSVTVHLRDGVMTASFETSNDEATRVLSHSLGQLKSGLEAAGVNVDKIHVEQAPKRDTQGDSDSDNKQPAQDQQRQAQQDQQRREMVRQMWKKLAGGDPLDLVA